MRNLRRFLRLSTTEKWFLVKTALLLETIKVAMWLLPFRVLRRLAETTGKIPVGLRQAERFSAHTVGWAVQTLSRKTPGEKTCLAQALAAQVLLVRRGYPALLHIGVLRDDKGAFQAHAWVECEGEVVVGGHELERYTLLTTLEGNVA
jgi:hypothetical protein